MMKIVVYGPGCARCRQTEQTVRSVLAELDIAVDIEKISDFQAMAAACVLATPAVTVDGVMKMSRRIPKPEEVKAWLTT